MIASFRLSALLALAFLAASCGDLPPRAAAHAGAAARTAPDDSDAWNLVPATASSLADLDLAALRASPWSRALVTGGFVEDREERLRAFGYDVFNDADRMLVAAIDVTGQERQIVVVMGRLDGARVFRAFREATPGARETVWRDCHLWEGTRGKVAVPVAVALVGRALVQGTPETVRAAIDAAWGIVPDARGAALGALARELGAFDHRPAVTLALVVTDDVRARAQGVVDLPRDLRRGAARLDLGADLELSAVAILDDDRGAAAAARLWSGSLRDLQDNRMLRLMGMSPLIDGASLGPEGARVRGRLRVPADKREGLSERLLFLLQALAKQRGPASLQP